MSSVKASLYCWVCLQPGTTHPCLLPQNSVHDPHHIQNIYCAVFIDIGGPGLFRCRFVDLEDEIDGEDDVEDVDQAVAVDIAFLPGLSLPDHFDAVPGRLIGTIDLEGELAQGVRGGRDPGKLFDEDEYSSVPMRRMFTFF